MNRPQAIAVVLGLAGLLGLLAVWRWPVAAPGFPCPDGGPLQLGADGVASCAAGAPLPPGQALTLGQKFDCNTATEAELSLVPGIGASLAHALVLARDGGFVDWGQLDAVPGVGATRLKALQLACDIRVGDAGLW